MTAAEDHTAAIDRDAKGMLFSIIAGVAVVIMAVAGVIIDNQGEATLAEAARAFFMLGSLAIAAPVALFRLGGAFRLVGYICPVALFCFFKFVGFLTVAESVGMKNEDAFLAALAFLTAIIVAAAQSFHRREERLAAFVAFVTGASALASVGALAPVAMRPHPPFEPVLASLTKPSPRLSADVNALPDIIYIVPDRYGSGDAFDREFGIDSGAFAEQLQERGFYVGNESRSNYAKTFQSLASSLNMTYLDDLIDVMGPNETNRQPIFQMIEDSAVQSSLRGLGYDFVHLGSWWEPTRRNRNANYNFDGLDNAWSSLNEFERALFRTTPVATTATHGGFVARAECDRLKAQLNYLKTARTVSDKPVFIFAHLTMPHDPITMNRSGECIDHIYYPGSGVSYDRYKAAFRDYVGYLNERLLAIFDANRALKRDRDFIFVIQADEGPYPKRLHENGEMDMFGFTEEETRLKFGIVNALYWDAERYGSPHLTQTPINNWRIILSTIAGAGLPPIEDERSHQFRDEAHVYQLQDVTSILAASDHRNELRAASD